MENKDLLPDYPRTFHLPWNPNAQRNDLIVPKKEAEVIFSHPNLVAEEKIDGANCGMCYYEEHPVIRNRSSFITKGQPKARTAAKMQFASIYNWFYENVDKFTSLHEIVGCEVSVYGEWMYALHGISYDKLPDVFVAYDVYDFSKGLFFDPIRARQYLTDAGFATVPLLHQGPIEDWDQLEDFCKEKSHYSSTDVREGVYIKIGNGEELTHRFKMVRQGFVQGCHWSDKMITRNKVEK